MDPFIISLISVIVGYLLSYWTSFQTRKQQKEQFGLSIKQQKEQFDLNIKHQKELNSLERTDKFRIVAVEKRLDAHQRALKHWYELLSVIHEENEIKRRKVIDEANEFWISHSMYLEKETRKRFQEAIHIVETYPLNLKMYRHSNNDDEKKRINESIKENWNKFHELHPLIFEEVELEPIISPKKNDNPTSSSKTS